jgi:hypothetical protein
MQQKCTLGRYYEEAQWVDEKFRYLVDKRLGRPE